MVHLDVMDGMFVTNISFGLPVIASLRKNSDMFFDVHLMIEKPERYIERFIDAGADLVTFHYEACEDSASALKLIRSRGKKAGISVGGTRLVCVEYYTASGRFCKAAKVTKLDGNFR
jgi:ribulose-phosphate 3-epimerase